MPYLSKSLPVAFVILCTSLTTFCQKKRELSQFSYNDKYFNQLIVDRIPDYGFTGRDGCIVEQQIKLALKDIDQQKIEGLVKDAKSNDALVGATVILIRRNGHKETLATDSLGRFQLDRSSPVKEIQILYIGYRRLKIIGKKWGKGIPQGY